jgi:hypothetical protein
MKKRGQLMTTAECASFCAMPLSIEPVHVRDAARNKWSVVARDNRY